MKKFKEMNIDAMSPVEVERALAEAEQALKDIELENRAKETKIKKLDEALRIQRNEVLLPDKIAEYQRAYAAAEPNVMSPRNKFDAGEQEAEIRRVLDPLRAEAKKLLDQHNIAYEADERGLPVNGFNKYAAPLTFQKRAPVEVSKEESPVSSPSIPETPLTAQSEETGKGVGSTDEGTKKPEQTVVATQSSNDAERSSAQDEKTRRTVARMMNAGRTNLEKTAKKNAAAEAAGKEKEDQKYDYPPFEVKMAAPIPVMPVAEKVPAEAAIEAAKHAIEAQYSFVPTKKTEDPKAAPTKKFSYTYTGAVAPTGLPGVETTTFVVDKPEPGAAEKTGKGIKMIMSSVRGFFTWVRNGFKKKEKPEEQKTAYKEPERPYKPWPLDPNAPKMEARTATPITKTETAEAAPAPVATPETKRTNERKDLEADLIFLNKKIQSHQGIITVSESDLKSQYGVERYRDLKHVPEGKDIIFNSAELRLMGDGLENMLSGKPQSKEEENAAAKTAQERTPRYDAAKILDEAPKRPGRILTLEEANRIETRRSANPESVIGIATKMFDDAFQGTHGLDSKYLHATDTPEWKAIMNRPAQGLIGATDNVIIRAHAKFFNEVNQLSKSLKLPPRGNEETLKEFVPRVFGAAAEKRIQEQFKQAA